MLRTLLLCVCLLCLISPAGAGSLNMLHYPDMDCYRTPYFGSTPQESLDAYNYCVKKYLQAVEEDIKTLEQKYNRAVEEYNRTVKSLTR